MTPLHYYPPELAGALRQCWPASAPALPPPAVLTQFISVLYQTSLCLKKDAGWTATPCWLRLRSWKPNR